MKSLRLLYACAYLTVASIVAAHAQQFESYTFSGVVTHIDSEGRDVAADIDIGDRVTASIVFDSSVPLAQEFDGQGEWYNSFDFKMSGGAHFKVEVGNSIFHSLPVDQMDEQGEIIAIHTRQAKTKFFEDFDCTLRFVQRYESVELQRSLNQFGLYLTAYNCDNRRLPGRLPSNIQITEWNDIRLSFEIPNSGFTARFWVDISAFQKNFDESGNVIGSVFADQNTNCSNDDANALANNLIKFTPGPYYAVTDVDGNFSSELPLENFSAEVIERPLWKFTCIDGPSEIVLDSDGESVQIHYAMEAEELVQALDVSLAAGMPRPGFLQEYSIQIQNFGTLPYSGTVSFTHDELLTEFESVPSADGYGNSQAEWFVNDLPIGGVKRFQVLLKVPADVSLIGVTVCASVESEIDRKSHSEILRNSADEFCREIRGAFDPNDIQVFSGALNADGPISTDDKVLSYIIRFQNEGNEDALTVRIVDPLSEFHNIESVRFGASSHEAAISFTNAGALEWTFNNINLPPKSVDEAASQGFVKFEVRLNDALAVGTEIPNKAAIYFDFNSPVITNTVVSKIVNTTTSVTPELDASAVNIFPNPTADRLTLRFEQPAETTLTLRNVLGQTMFSETVNSAVHSLDLRTLAAGSYFLTVETAAGSLVKAVNVAR